MRSLASIEELPTDPLVERKAKNNSNGAVPLRELLQKKDDHYSYASKVKDCPCVVCRDRMPMPL